MKNNILQSDYVVRFSDCDPFQHLNNSKYVDYFLNAREDHLRSAYNIDLAVLASQGQAWVVKNHTISYLRPAFYNEPISIQSMLLGVTEDTLLLEMIMLDRDKKQLKAIMHTEFVSISPGNGKRCQHTPEFFEFLKDKVLPIPEAFSHQARIEHWSKELKNNRQINQ